MWRPGLKALPGKFVTTQNTFPLTPGAPTPEKRFTGRASYLRDELNGGSGHALVAYARIRLKRVRAIFFEGASIKCAFGLDAVE
jgi:hypothetical protein